MTSQSQPEGIKPEKKPKNSKWKSIGVFFSCIAILLSIAALSYSYFQLAAINIYLAKMVTGLQQNIDEVKTNLNGLQNSVTALKDTNEKTQQLFKEQTKLVSEWQTLQKGDSDKWHVAEAQYLVRLANDNARFTHDTPKVISLLQEANRLIEPLKDAQPDLAAISQALSSNIANLEKEPQIDVSQLFLKLNDINSQLDQLQLNAGPIQTSATDLPTTLPPSSAELPWWKAGFHRTLQALGQIVIVKRFDKEGLPLIFPEEKVFLLQNLHAQIESALWGLLNREPVVYQTSLKKAISWIEKYFEMNSTLTKQILENLTELSQVNIQPNETNLSASLQLFDRYFAQLKTNAPKQPETSPSQ